MTSISLIICTVNRSASLRRTLVAVDRLTVPADWRVEVIVMDNASTDDTAAVVKAFSFQHAELRYVLEPRKGKCHALNTGMAQARGDYLLFTDDDVIPAASWLMEMVEPMRTGRCDAVNGQLILAPHLIKSWQTPMHKMWLAASLEAESRDWSREVIGANMGIKRAVLERVSEYDPELGPGPEAVGFCEDTFFGRLLFEAGFKIEFIPSATAVHELDESRLQRRVWLADAARRGRTQAYLRYHWEHDDIPWPRLKRLLYSLKLHARRLFTRLPPLHAEGCPTWEMSYVMHQAMCHQFALEQRRPRNYERRGLIKRQSAASPSRGARSARHPAPQGRSVAE
jgi:glycosyltransferase involved in cell wall biosynthesis